MRAPAPGDAISLPANSAMTRYAIKARYLLPVDAPPIHDGQLVVNDGRIEAVELSPNFDGPVVDLGNVAILPGLVNAHVHLEFSALDSPLGSPGMSLPDWIRLVMQYRAEATPSPAEAIGQGVEESLRHGTTSLGEIATCDWPAPVSVFRSADITAFRELIAPTDNADRIAECVRLAGAHVASARSAASWRGGISPHASYSAHPRLLQSLADSPALAATPVAIHLAESPEEMEWLRTGAGPFTELLSELGIPESFPGPRSPLDLVEALNPFSRSLVIHGNYLDAEAIARLGTMPSASVVYCPRTHTFFEHDAYPLAEMLAAGMNVALGSDGRCSNPDLSLLTEMRHVAVKHPHVSLAQVLRMGTLAGATALGRDDEVGSLAQGKLANLAIVSLPEDDGEQDPLALVLHRHGKVAATVYRGQLAYATEESLTRNWPAS